MVNKNYNFANISFAVKSDVEIADTKFFAPFCTEKAKNADFNITVKNGRIPERTGIEIYNNKTAALYENAGEKLFYSSYPVMLSDCCTDYACLKRNGSELVLTADGGLRDNVLFRAVNVSALMLEKGAALFHSSFVIADGEAIVFTGVSGAGKTTQALLWQKYRGATLVNGDRSALKFVDGVLYALPVPFCGSSDVALNERAKVRAIVSLDKGEHNEISSLKASEAFKEILGGISYEPKSADESNTAVDFAISVASTGMIYKMKCRKDETAVQAFEMFLNGVK